MTLTAPANAVAIFVRHPLPGRVKTRLACDLGGEEACELYRAMVADCIANVQSAGLPLYLFHDGQSAVGLPPDWVTAATDVIAQTGASLGDRMTAAFQELYRRGVENVVLTGSDIPGVDSELLRAAMAAVDGYDVVFAPALDGGYCLVASHKNRFTPLVFRNIPWSTSDTLSATTAVCAAAGLTYTLLEPRQDIDTLEDLRTYCRQPCHTARHTNAWLGEHQYLTLPL